MVDNKMLRKACSQEINKHALAEHKKHKKLATTQTKAAKKDATLTVRKIVAKQAQTKSKNKKSENKNTAKPKHLKGSPPKGSNSIFSQPKTGGKN
ncbi:hypothetical protein DSO57_1036856 [Entomophthora muscae]|uniref:Uncharacterized protein n=1 Tax=Entomophthora muscae TaxID=34485 RepID=A0ACC2U8N7_9FUNG|nr:hypothetical protein DSO57_1036856 [Entomophthora muscae]